MTTAQHGKRALFYADVTENATGTITKVPMLVDWTLDKDIDFVDTTHTESENKEDVDGFGNFNGTLNFNDDLDSDAIDTMTDGAIRTGILYRNHRAAAGKRKYDYGPMRFSMSASGGVSSKVGASVKFRAAGAITHGYA